MIIIYIDEGVKGMPTIIIGILTGIIELI